MSGPASRPATGALALQVSGLAGVYQTSLRSALALRGEVVIGGVALLVRVVLVTLVWRAVYGDRASVGGVERDAAVAYAVLGAVFTNVLNPYFRSTPQTRVRRGQVAVDLLRPVGLVPQTLAQQLGVTASSVPRCVAAVLLALAIGSLQPPASGALGVALFVVSTALGIAIALLTNLVVAMSAFWTLEAGGALSVYNAVAQFASGALIPLWFMPGWLRAVLEWLPFQAQVFTPLSVYFGAVRGWDAGVAIGVQLLWVVLLAALAQLVWSRALRRVVVQGG